MGEAGADTGGLTREFFRLFGKGMADKINCFKHNSVALQAREHYHRKLLVTYLTTNVCVIP